MKLRKILHTLLIIGAVLLLVGGIVFAVSFASTGFDLKTFSYVRPEEKTYVEQGNVTEISVTAESAHVYLYNAKAGQPLTVEYTRRKSREGDLLNDVTVVEEEGRLTLTETEESDGRLLLLDVTKPQIEIYLPADRTYEIEINIDVGNARVNGVFSATTVVLNAKSGSIYTEKSTFTCEALALSAVNGGINFGEVTADDVTASATNGSISINGNVTTDAFSATTKNGQIYYRSSVLVANDVTLQADRGNVKAKLRGKKDDYLTSITVKDGRSNVDATETGEKKLTLIVTDGTIHIDFEGE